MQKEQRFVADQRFDLPNYNSMIRFIAEEFHNYNQAFISKNNKIVSGWKIVDGGGLVVNVDISDFSLLMNSERPGREAINFRPITLPQLSLTLDDAATNFVEVELFEATTANDSVSIWDPTANSGQGEEFIQNVDTAKCQDARLVSNTVSFSIARPDRIPLAEVTTIGGAITTIVDSRDFFFRLATDFDFDGTAFGVPRTDKVIQTLKQDSDAIKTIIKEMKDPDGLLGLSWFDPENSSTLDLLDRMNYMLTAGGTISWELPKGATGSLISHLSNPVTGIADGDTFTISDGTTSLIFEFDSDSSAPTNAVPISIEGTAAAVKTSIISAINGAAFTISASDGGGNRIELINSAVGTVGNVAITESISNSASLNPLGMSGGFDSTELTWSGALKIIAPSHVFEYTIDAQTISIADGEVAFVTLPSVGVAPGASLPVTVLSSATYLINSTNTRGYIIAYRSGTKIYFGNGWQNVELEDGESNQLGDGITGEWVTATGLVDETDDTPPYTSNHFVSPDASFTQAISELDEIVEALFNLVTGVQYDEFTVLPGITVAGTKIKLPPPFGLGSFQTYQTGFRQLEVFFNGKKVNEGALNDWIEVANIGAGIGDEIELAFDLGTVDGFTAVGFRIQTGGGQDGTVTADAPDVLDEGIIVVSTVGKLNFVGAGVRIDVPVAGTADVIIQFPREIGRICKNGSGGLIPAGKVVAWLDDGTVALADANIVALSDIVGCAAENISAGAFGTIIRTGSVPSALFGLSATSGDEVFLSGVPGDLTLTAPTGFGDTIIRMGRAEPPDAVATVTADDLYLRPEIIAAP